MNDAINALADTIEPHRLMTYRERENEAKRILAALRAAGYAVVPREPSEAMRAAAAEAQAVPPPGASVTDIWQAMIEAAEGVE